MASKTTQLLVAASLTLAALVVPAHADPSEGFRTRPPSGDPHRRQADPWREVIRFARLLEEDARRLHDRARSAATRLSESQARALRDLRILLERAERFHRQAARPQAGPPRADAEYGALRQAYFTALDSFRAFRPSFPVREAMTRVSETARELFDAYEYARYGGRPYWDGNEVFLLASELDDLTDRLYRRARDESRNAGAGFRNGQLKVGADRLEDLETAIDRLKARVKEHRTDPRRSLPEYNEVARLYEKASPHMHHFSRAVREDFARTGRLIDALTAYYLPRGRTFGG